MKVQVGALSGWPPIVGVEPGQSACGQSVTSREAPTELGVNESEALTPIREERDSLREAAGLTATVLPPKTVALSLL